MRRAVLALAVIAALSACTSDAGNGNARRSDATATPTSSSSPTPPGAAAPSASPTPASSSPSPAASPITVVPGDFRGWFSTPSGNITCRISDGWVVCRARDAPWQDAPRTERCDARWRTTIELIGVAAAKLRGDCYDVLEQGSGPPLPYDHALQVGQTRCVSLRTELQCLAVGTRRGFVVNRSSYRLTATTSGLATAPTPRPAGASLTIVPAGFAGGFSFPFGRDGDGGLACDMSDTDVGCVVNGRTDWRPPPRSEPCGDSQGDTTTEVELRDGVGRAEQTCRSDTNSGGPPLRVGHGIRVGPVECLARANGLTCTDRRTGHGFRVSAAEFRAV